MKIRSLVLILFFCICIISYKVSNWVFGLSISENDLLGTYQDIRNNGKEYLTLSTNGIYKYTFQYHTGEKIYFTGKWHYKKDSIIDCRVVLDNALSTPDTINPQQNEKAILLHQNRNQTEDWTMKVYYFNGCFSLGINEETGFYFEKIK